MCTLLIIFFLFPASQARTYAAEYMAVRMGAQPPLYFLVYGKRYTAGMRPLHRVPSGWPHGAVPHGLHSGVITSRTMQMIRTHDCVIYVRGNAQKQPASPMPMFEFSSVGRPQFLNSDVSSWRLLCQRLLLSEMGEALDEKAVRCVPF